MKLVLKGATIISDIENKINNGPERLLIVAEGTSYQKIAKIRSNPYFNAGYERLTQLTGALFIFGSSASVSDQHIYDAICKSDNLRRVFFCVHNPTRDLKMMRERLARYHERRKSVEWSYIDAGTVNVWTDG